MKTETMKTLNNCFTLLLAVVFITLKLVGVITWSWWWVFSPLWLGFAVTALVTILVFAGALLVILRERR